LFSCQVSDFPNFLEKSTLKPLPLGTLREHLVSPLLPPPGFFPFFFGMQAQAVSFFARLSLFPFNVGFISFQSFLCTFFFFQSTLFAKGLRQQVPSFSPPFFFLLASIFFPVHATPRQRFFTLMDLIGFSFFLVISSWVLIMISPP